MRLLRVTLHCSVGIYVATYAIITFAKTKILGKKKALIEEDPKKKKVI